MRIVPPADVMVGDRNISLSGHARSGRRLRGPAGWQVGHRGLDDRLAGSAGQFGPEVTDDAERAGDVVENLRLVRGQGPQLPVARRATATLATWGGMVDDRIRVASSKKCSVQAAFQPTISGCQMRAGIRQSIPSVTGREGSANRAMLWSAVLGYQSKNQRVCPRPNAQVALPAIRVIIMSQSKDAVATSVMGGWEWTMLLALAVLWGGSFFFNAVAVRE